MNRGLDLNHCSKLRHFLHGESQGQGTTEFILVLLLTVGIVLGAALQLNQSFASFARNYFGDYLQCLLRRGELPALGIQDPTASTCNANYQPFTLAEGRPFVGYNVTFGSGSGSGGSGELVPVEAVDPDLVPITGAVTVPEVVKVKGRRHRVRPKVQERLADEEL